MNYGDPRLPTRFWDKVIPVPFAGCWLWLAYTGTGYGIFRVRRDGEQSNAKAHRVAFETLVGKVPSDMHLDHLCRTRECVNPAHLEITTPKENILRGVGMGARNARKERCPRGHAYVQLDKQRVCLECTRATQDARSRRYVAAKATRGICASCTAPAEPGKKRCAACAKKSYEGAVLRTERRVAEGICTHCDQPATDGQLCDHHGMRIRFRNERRRWRLRGLPQTRINLLSVAR